MNAVRTSAMTRPYVIGIYIRLSKEDEDIKYGSGKLESDSITNQRMLITDYIRKQPEFVGAVTVEKCDDGYSGKKFDRPAFLELIEMAKKGEIDCIIVKDFSRFGRDYVEIGDYLEQIFPFLGIRFISINDHYDSAKNGNRTLELDVVFKNFIYDTYSRDTSRKIRDVRHKLAKEGSFASPNAPYGYLKSKMDKHKLIVNPDTAPVVKEIFDLKLAGNSGADIARILNAKGIPSPAQYAIDKGTGMDWRKINEKTGWNDSVILYMLRDERYVGHMVSLKRTLRGIYGKETKVNKEEWVKVLNTHEGIVSETDFAKVQEMVAGFEKPFTGRSTNVFVCGRCGRKMSKSKNKTYYLCRYGVTNPLAACYNFRMDADELQQAVLRELKEHFKMFLLQEEVREKYENTKIPVKENRYLYEKNLKLLEVAKTSLYEKYKEGQLTKEEYMVEKKALDQKINEIKIQLCAETEQDDKGIHEKKLFAELVEKYKNETELTPQLQETFIEKVVVYSEDRISIKWKFDDVVDISHQNMNIKQLA